MSSFAAQPPLIPEPTTIASKFVDLSHGDAPAMSCALVHRRSAVEAAGHDSIVSTSFITRSLVK